MKLFSTARVQQCAKLPVLLRENLGIWGWQDVRAEDHRTGSRSIAQGVKVKQKNILKIRI